MPNWRTDIQNPNKFAVVIVATATGHSVFVPDLPGCLTVGGSYDEALAMIFEAIEIHIQSLQETGEMVPMPSTLVGQVSVHAA